MNTTEVLSWTRSLNLQNVAYALAVFGLYWLCSRFLFAPKVIRDPRNTPKRNGKGKRIGQMPPPYPNGWYKILDSCELKRGETKYLQMFGGHFAIYRGEDGKVRMLDAYCPHLGANLGVEGKVKGNCIECPFHGWQFDGQSGKCTSIPYCESSKIPDVARVNVFTVSESNQMIYFYWNADGDDFTWTVPDFPYVNEGIYVYHGCMETQVQAHIQEIPENGADVQHLGFLHVPSLISFIPWLNHVWSANWKPGEEETGDEHIGYVTLSHRLTFMGKLIPGTTVNANIKQVGPGLVHLELCTGVGVFYVTETVTPIAPMKQKVTHVIFGPNNWFHRTVAKVILTSFVAQFMRDYEIWNNKVFLRKPLLVRNDGPISAYRRWYSKFYPRKPIESGNTLDW